MPHGGKRAIVRCRDDHYLHPVPPLNIQGCRGSPPRRPPGRRGDALCQAFREAGILTSLDGGGLRSNTHELLDFIDVAIVAERLCEQMNLTPAGMLGYLKSRGGRIGGVTLGERGLVWYDENGIESVLPALAVPSEAVVDTNGAGDTFHGAYMYSAMAQPELTWREHFVFARAASAHAIQHLGNEASLPSLGDIEQVQNTYKEGREVEGLLDDTAPDLALTDAV